MSGPYPDLGLLRHIIRCDGCGGWIWAQHGCATCTMLNAADAEFLAHHPEWKV